MGCSTGSVGRGLEHVPLQVVGGRMPFYTFSVLWVPISLSFRWACDLLRLTRCFSTRGGRALGLG